MIHNKDPVGRAWQQNALRRSRVALDTDVVLSVLIEDLPESAAVLRCLKALQGEGVEIIVPEAVIAEVVGHIERAPKTQRRFGARLKRLSPDMIDGHVWHAVVRGYYYAERKSTTRLTWDQYYGNYQKANRQMEYVRHMLSKRVQHRVGDPGPVELADHGDIEAITATLLERKEKRRRKAEFREPAEKQNRLREDVRFAVAASRAADPSVPESHGYLVSIDGVFKQIEAHPVWGGRAKVHVFTKFLPSLCEFVCGTTGVGDDVTVRMFFDPVVGAAAQLLGDDIDRLTASGIDFSHHTLDSIEWELRDEFQKVVHAGRREDASEDERTIESIRIAEAARAKGFAVEPAMQRVIDKFDDLQAQLTEEQGRREDAEERASSAEAHAANTVQKIASAAAGQTKRGRSRVRRALANMGLDLDDLLAEVGRTDDDTE
jgi:predicted nucleic acid-binding protein